MLPFKQPLFCIIMVSPKRKSSDADNSEMPKRSHKVLFFLSGKICMDPYMYSLYICIESRTVHGCRHPEGAMEHIPRG